MLSIGLLFWICMLLWLVLGLWAWWPLTRDRAPSLFFWFLLFLLGWGVFGFPISGK